VPEVHPLNRRERRSLSHERKGKEKRKSVPNDGPNRRVRRLMAVARRRGQLTSEDIPQLREHWGEEYADMFAGVPPEMPPLRVINHEINLIDDNKRINYRLPKCPDALREELSAKVKRYTDAGWWEPATVRQAAPMLCIPKKTGKLRTVFDLRQQNENTEKDVTPFPDQDAIRHDVARATPASCVGQ
jgi:hypothetical protein